jgi:hypothetical protein
MTSSARAHLLARQIALVVSGKVRPSGAATNELLPASPFDVKASMRGMPLRFEVFDGGCTVIGVVVDRRTPPLALNHPIWRLTEKVAGRFSTPAFRLPSAPDGPVQAMLRDARVAKLLSKLRLTGKEVLAIADGSFFFVHHSTDLRQLFQRLNVLLEIFAPPPPVVLVSERAHRIAIGRVLKGDQAAARHAFGGILEPGVACRNCKTPVHLLLTFDTTDRALGLKSWGKALPVLFCLDCMSFPSLTYVDHSRRHPRMLQQERSERFMENSPLDARGVQLTPVASSAKGSKVGGAPTWIQGPEVPECITCKAPMAFLAQLASTRHVAFADEGRLYTFVCAACRVSASLVQSH